MKPYFDKKISDYQWLRTFDPSIHDSEEYVWHRDKKDRIVTVLEGSGWRFQFDNELPKCININDVIEIPSMKYHRIIPGETLLTVQIEEKAHGH
jgi:hypothetical protein